ncbi:MAG: heme-degrading monooxygenase HmoA [Halioglobus sp.]
MILEVAMLDVISTEEEAFEAAFSEAQKIISSREGYISHQLQKSMETPGRYVLLVNWVSQQAHTVDFRASQEYQEWKALLHHFYDPFPVVEYFESVFENGT